jgi:hypothetical protein
VEAVAGSSHAATVRQCSSERLVYVAVDGSSLSLTDRMRSRDIGQVGQWRHPSRGLIVASALAISAGGTPIGLCGQHWWAREQRSTRKPRSRFVSPEKTEMRHSLAILKQAHERFVEQAPQSTPWFQIDRGFDAWAVLALAAERQMCMTVRIVHDRCIRESPTQKKAFLLSCMHRAPIIGSHQLQIPARQGRPARLATLEVRARKLSVELRVSRRKRVYVPMYGVSVRETRGRRPLQWKLLTTVPVHSLQDALAVVHGYTMRWRIEEFHRAWKQGICHVEDTQLRGRSAIQKWATIHSAVATRALRLSYQAREKPTSAATDELSRHEIDATIVLLRPKGIERGATPTLEQAVLWIAELGGFAGRYSKRPPGPTVIARGLERVEVAAIALLNAREM